MLKKCLGMLLFFTFTYCVAAEEKLGFITSNTSIFATSALLQPDGKLLVVGGAMCSRYNHDGSFDASFGSKGSVLTYIGPIGALIDIALQADNKIVALGNGDLGVIVVRYNPDGSLDNSFGENGKVFTGNIYESKSIHIQADGKILVVGQTVNATNNSIALLRYNANGSLDTSFSDDGIVTIKSGENTDVITAALQSNGRIVVLANSSVLSGYPGGDDFRINTTMILARLNPDGSLDSSFDGDGLLYYPLKAENNLKTDGKSLSIQNDGKIVVVANSPWGHLLVYRFTKSGQFDASYYGESLKHSSTSYYAGRVKMQRDDKIIFVGSYSINDISTFKIQHFNANGGLDTHLGKENSKINYPSKNISDFVVQQDGKIILVGSNGNERAFFSVIARYDTNNHLDTGFGMSAGVIPGSNSTGGKEDDTIYGGNGDSFLRGGDGNDKLFGEVGNDILYGGLGDDILNGGNDENYSSDKYAYSGYDTAAFNIHKKEVASIRQFKSGEVMITSPEGTDKLIKIEALQFLDESGDLQRIVREIIASKPLPDYTLTNSDGVKKIVKPTLYTGAVATLEYQYLGTKKDDNIVASSGNDFIALLNGDDTANGGLGDDILDGGTGTNYLTGGGGDDTFYVDGRHSKASSNLGVDGKVRLDGQVKAKTWTTITDFNAGDSVIIWGWNPQLSKLKKVAKSEGKEGLKGVTYYYDLNDDGVTDTIATFSHLTANQLPQAKEMVGHLLFE